MGFGRYPAMVCPFAENGTLTSYLDRGHARLPVAEILRLVSYVSCSSFWKRTLILFLSARQRCFWPTVL